MNSKSVFLDYTKTQITALNLLNGNYFENKVGLFILIGLQTGLRSVDILKLNKLDFEKTEKGAKLNFIANKTKKEGVLFISSLVYDEVIKCNNDFIFFNSENKTHFSHTWINRRLKQLFENEYIKACNKGKTISVHSLRKTAGKNVYKNFGIESARKFLQHRSYDTTKLYLEIDNDELIENLTLLHS